MLLKIAYVLILLYILSPIGDKTDSKFQIKNLPSQFLSGYKKAKAWMHKQYIKFDDWQRMI